MKYNRGSGATRRDAAAGLRNLTLEKCTQTLGLRAFEGHLEVKMNHDSGICEPPL